MKIIDVIFNTPNVTKILLCFILAVSLVPLANASSYVLNYTKTNIKTNISTGETSLGYYIFYTTITNLSYYNVTDANVTSYNLKYNDYLYNNLNQTIVLGTTTVATNSSTQLLTIGNFSLYKLGEIVAFANVTVVMPDAVNVSLNESNNEFAFSFSPQTFAISSNEQIVNVNLTYNYYTTSQQYSILVQSYNNTIDTLIFTLNPIEKFSFSIVNCTYELPINTHGTFCVLNLSNLGNEVSDVDFSVDKHATNFNLPQGIALFVQSSKLVTLYYDIVDITNVLSDVINITATGDSYSYSQNFSVNFTDRIFPYFNNFSIGDMEAMKFYHYNFEVIENLNMSSIKVRFLLNSTVVQEIEATKGNYNFYSFNVTLNQTGNYSMELILKDQSENINITAFNFQVTPLNTIAYNQNIQFKKIRYNSYVVQDFIYLGQDMPINVSIISVNYINNSKWSLRFFNANNSREFYVDSTNHNTSLVIDTAGNWTIAFLGDMLANYNGVIRLTVPDYHVAIGDIIFSGQVINYSIPETFSNTKWVEEGSLSCRVYDTGLIETSKYICTVEYPLDSSSAGNTILPMTLEAVNNVKEKYDAIIENWKTKNSWKLGLIITLLISILLISLYSAWSIFVQPRLKLKLK